MTTTINNELIANPFNVFEQADVTAEMADVIEPKNNILPRVTINLRKAREEALYCALVGRDGKYAFGMLDKADPRKLIAHQCGDIDSNNYGSEMLLKATSIINEAVNKRVNIVLYSVDAVAIAWRQYRGISKSFTDIDVDKIISAMTSTKFFQALPEDSTDMVAKRQKASEAIIAFVEAMAMADSEGIYIDIQKQSELNKLMLSVPEGVELSEGQVLKFENGYANDITVIGWKNFERNVATVHVQNSSNGSKNYFLWAKNPQRLTRLEQCVHSLIGQLWAECPVEKVEVDMSSCENVSFSF